MSYGCRRVAEPEPLFGREWSLSQGQNYTLEPRLELALKYPKILAEICKSGFRIRIRTDPNVFALPGSGSA